MSAPGQTASVWWSNSVPGPGLGVLLRDFTQFSQRPGPSRLSTSEKEVTHNALGPLGFSLSAGCVLIYSFNKHSFAFDPIPGMSQVLKEDEEGQSPHASCPQGFSVQKGRRTHNWMGRGGGKERGMWSRKAS